MSKLEKMVTDLSKNELLNIVSRQRNIISNHESLIKTLENNISELVKPKGTGTHRCHLCHEWVNPNNLYEVKADACEDCMKAQLNPHHMQVQTYPRSSSSRTHAKPTNKIQR